MRASTPSRGRPQGGPLANGAAWTRRGVLAAASWSAAALASRRAGAQVTDLRGFDPLWRDAEDAIRAFFGDVTYDRDGLTISAN